MLFRVTQRPSRALSRRTWIVMMIGTGPAPFFEMLRLIALEYGRQGAQGQWVTPVPYRPASWRTFLRAHWGAIAGADPGSGVVGD